MMLFFSILLSLILGFLSCHFIFKQAKTINVAFLINLSFPIGLGLSSVIFIFFNLLGFSSSFIFLIEIAIVLFLFLRIRKIYNPATNLTSGKRENKSVYQFDWLNFNKLILNPILLLATILYFYSWIVDVGVFFFDTVHSPHGLWDAWSCWNLISKIISRAPHDWPSLLHQMNPADFHPDYPLLQRGFIARCWLLIGNESVLIPIVSSFIFTFCTIGLLSSSVSFFSNKIEGLIAGLVLLCTPFFMIMGDSQYADNTVGFFYLATIILLTFARKGVSTKPHLLIAAGVTAGLSAWSKNEGLLFILCLFTSQLTLLFFKNYRELLTELKYILWGMLPILLLVAYFKIAIASPNQIMSAQGTGTFLKLTDFSRYETVYKWFVVQFSTFGKWDINPWWLFLLGILFKGISIKENNYSFIPNFTWLLLMLTGFFLVEIITPFGLMYYLSTSVHRLFFQLFPTFIFIYFLAINGKSSGQKSNKINTLIKKILNTKESK